MSADNDQADVSKSPTADAALTNWQQSNGPSNLTPPDIDANRVAEIAPVDRLLRQLMQKAGSSDLQSHELPEKSSESSHDSKLFSSGSRPDWYHEHLLAALPARFKIRRLLGSGTFGTVFLAVDTRLSREVAIKILRPEWMSTAESKLRFIRESRATARLNHTNIVRVLEADENERIVWQVSDVIEGVSLAEHLKHSQLPIELTVRFIEKIAEALDFAHQRGIVHRDVKPANILINRPVAGELSDSDAYLMDFGLARIVDDDLTLSRSGQLVGTPQYLAPELFESGTGMAGPVSDIYSLGAVLLECLIGRRPFENAQGLGELYRLTTQSRAELLQSARSIPRDLTVICQKAMAIDPCDRYATAGQLADDLRCFSQGLPISARPLQVHELLWRSARKNPAVSALMATLMLSLLVIAGMAWRSSYQSRQQNEILAESNQTLAKERNNARSLASLAESLRDQAMAERNSFQQLAWNSRIQEAYHCYQSGDWGEALQLLDSLQKTHPQYTSRFEWRLLTSQLRSRISEVAHLGGNIRELRPVPNSNLLAAVAENRVYLVDVVSRKIDRTLETPVEELHALTVHPSQPRLFFGGSADPHTNRVLLLSLNWNESGPPTCLDTFPTTLESIAITEDGQHLLCGARYEPPRLIRLEDSYSESLTGNRRNLWLLDLPKLQRMVFQYDSQSIVVVDPQNTEHCRRLSFKEAMEGEYIQAATSVDGGKWMAIATSKGNIYVLDLLAATAIARLKAPPMVSSLTCSKDGHLLAVGTDGGEVMFWELPAEVRTGSPIDGANISASSMEVTTNAIEFSLSPNLREILVPDERVRLHSVAVTSLAWKSDVLYCGTDTGHLKLILPSLNLVTNEWAWNSQSDTASVLETAWSKDAKHLILHDRAGPVTVIPQTAWSEKSSPQDSDMHPRPQFNPKLHEYSISKSMGDSEMISRLPAEPNTAFGLAILPDTSQIAWSLDRSEYCVFQHGSGKLNRLTNELADTRQDLVFEILDFSPDGSLLAAQAEKYQLHLLSTSMSAKPIASFELPGRTSCVAWSQDGSQLVAAGNFDSLVLCDRNSASTRKIATLHTATSAIYRLSHENTVLTGHVDGSIHFTNLETGQSERIPVHEASICSILCDAAERIGLSVDERGNVSVWSIPERQRLGVLWTGTNTIDPHIQILSSIVLTDDQKQLWMVYSAPKGPSVRCLQLLD